MAGGWSPGEGTTGGGVAEIDGSGFRLGVQPEPSGRPESFIQCRRPPLRLRTRRSRSLGSGEKGRDWSPSTLSQGGPMTAVGSLGARSGSSRRLESRWRRSPRALIAPCTSGLTAASRSNSRATESPSTRWSGPVPSRTWPQTGASPGRRCGSTWRRRRRGLLSPRAASVPPALPLGEPYEGFRSDRGLRDQPMRLRCGHLMSCSLFDVTSSRRWSGRALKEPVEVA